MWSRVAFDRCIPGGPGGQGRWERVGGQGGVGDGGVIDAVAVVATGEILRGEILRRSRLAMEATMDHACHPAPCVHPPRAFAHGETTSRSTYHAERVAFTTQCARLVEHIHAHTTYVVLIDRLTME